MATYGFNFRSTSGFVTDGADETYVITDSYPVTRNGITFGWENSVFAADRDSSVDRRLAGINYIGNSQTGGRTFRVDLPATGDHDIRLALGDAGSTQPLQYCEFIDDATTISTVDDTDGTTEDNFDDATGVNRTLAAWPTDNVAISHTFTSTIFRTRIGKGSGSGFSTIAHLSVEEVSGGGGSTVTATLTDSLTFSDTLARPSWFTRGTADSLSFSETLSAAITGAGSTFSRVLTDTLSFSDTLEARRRLLRRLTDTLAFSDSIDRSNSHFIRILSRFAPLSENLDVDSTGGFGDVEGRHHRFWRWREIRRQGNDPDEMHQR